MIHHNSTLTILTYKLKEPFLSFDALGYNATLKAEVCLTHPPFLSLIITP
jgi:hypothetical protein